MPHFHHWCGGHGGELLKEKGLDVQISIKMKFWNEDVNAGSENTARCTGQRDKVLVLPWKTGIALEHD